MRRDVNSQTFSTIYTTPGTVIMLLPLQTLLLIRERNNNTFYLYSAFQEDKQRPFTGQVKNDPR